MPDQKRKEFKRLVDNYLNGNASPEEQEALDRYYLLFSDEPEITRLLNEDQQAQLKERMENTLMMRVRQPARVNRLWPRIAAAASVLLCVAAGGYFLWPKQPQRQFARNDIAPGRNQATLTLANGHQIILTKSLNGKLATQGGTSVQVNAGSAITYMDKAVKADENAAVAYNTLSTSRGEQSPYVLILGDGTKVWLNAASSITYPVAFKDKNREVNITGEVYFEVIHDATHPFRVKAKGQTIEDIGTAFNVNAYDDEAVMKATLVSGSIKVINKDRSALLQPGQVAILTTHQNSIQVANVDTEGAVAWKNGYFLFEKEKLESIMRKVSRWYDVDIVFADERSKQTAYWGSITRYTRVSKVLSQLEETGHEHFRIEGNKIIITKK